MDCREQVWLYNWSSSHVLAQTFICARAKNVKLLPLDAIEFLWFFHRSKRDLHLLFLLREV
jgi:hypothetical protein